MGLIASNLNDNKGLFGPKTTSGIKTQLVFLCHKQVNVWLLNLSLICLGKGAQCGIISSAIPL